MGEAEHGGSGGRSHHLTKARYSEASEAWPTGAIFMAVLKSASSPTTNIADDWDGND